MQIKLLFFATLRQHAGTKALELEIPAGFTVQELKGKLSQDFPALRASLETALVAVNKEYAFAQAVIPPDAEVALFPPVSGG